MYICKWYMKHLCAIVMNSYSDINIHCKSRYFTYFFFDECVIQYTVSIKLFIWGKPSYFRKRRCIFWNKWSMNAQPPKEVSVLYIFIPDHVLYYFPGCSDFFRVKPSILCVYSFNHYCFFCIFVQYVSL